MAYLPAAGRYTAMKYKRCGKSGIKLPVISLGLWHNFGGVTQPDTSRAMLRRAFDLGINHFDLANNYGPPPGAAEEFFGTILKSDFREYRDELLISTKAGYTMWPGPYGDWGSKKYLVSSLEQSLKRMGLEYVDIFYHHRPDPETPLEETMGALDLLVRQGKALYVGLSRYSPQQTKQALSILKKLGTPCIIHQERYSMLDREIENGLFAVLEEEGLGSIAFSPLAKGVLTSRYLKGIPEDSRAASSSVSLKPEDLNEKVLTKVSILDQIASKRGQSLAQMALAWVLREGRLTSVIIGASRVNQIDDCVGSLTNLAFSQEELARINQILNS